MLKHWLVAMRRMCETTQQSCLLLDPMDSMKQTSVPSSQKYSAERPCMQTAPPYPSAQHLGVAPDLQSIDIHLVPKRNSASKLNTTTQPLHQTNLHLLSDQHSANPKQSNRRNPQKKSFKPIQANPIMRPHGRTLPTATNNIPQPHAAILARLSRCSSLHSTTHNDATLTPSVAPSV
jgi:hypothetical protein